VLAEDSQAFTTSLQQAFQLWLSDLTAQDFFSPLGPLALVFKRGVQAVLAQDTGIIEEGLLYTKLEQHGSTGPELLEQYISVRRAQDEVTQQALELLVAVVDAAWPNVPETVTSEDLLRLGFDDQQRPDPMDYW